MIRNCPSISCILNLSSPWSLHLTPVQSLFTPHCIWDIHFILLIADPSLCLVCTMEHFHWELTNPDRRCGQHKVAQACSCPQILLVPVRKPGTLRHGYLAWGTSPHLLSCHSLVLGPVPEAAFLSPSFVFPCQCSKDQEWAPVCMAHFSRAWRTNRALCGWDVALGRPWISG